MLEEHASLFAMFRLLLLKDDIRMNLSTASALLLQPDTGKKKMKPYLGAESVCAGASTAVRIMLKALRVEK